MAVQIPPAPRVDPLALVIADVEGLPEWELGQAPAPAESEPDEVATKELVIVSWSGELDRIWPTLILASTAAASGVRCRVFVTFWGLLPFVKDGVRITGESS